MALTKLVRFEVFKRDGFRCQYCGKTPPDVVLEIDHINPKSLGGKDDINNLLTSCFDCNRGKRNVPLSRIPNTLAINMDVLQERELQLREYNKLMKRVEKRIQSESIEVNRIYNNHFPKYELSPHFVQGSLKTFLKRLPLHEVIDAMALACFYMEKTRGYRASDYAIPYFCGICWNKIKANHNDDPKPT